VSELERTGGSASDELAALRKRNAELEALVKKMSDELGALKTTNAAQAKRIQDLLAEIEALKRRIAELEAMQKEQDDTFKLRMADLQEVNDWLLKLARSRSVQTNLQRSKVKLALECWGGGPVAQSLREDELEAIKWDEGVIELYPQLKEFEKVRGWVGAWVGG
jgi:chromosome segregation ATPase